MFAVPCVRFVICGGLHTNQLIVEVQIVARIVACHDESMMWCWLHRREGWARDPTPCKFLDVRRCPYVLHDTWHAYKGACTAHRFALPFWVAHTRCVKVPRCERLRDQLLACPGTTACMALTVYTDTGSAAGRLIVPHELHSLPPVGACTHVTGTAYAVKAYSWAGGGSNEVLKLGTGNPADDESRSPSTASVSAVSLAQCCMHTPSHTSLHRHDDSRTQVEESLSNPTQMRHAQSRAVPAGPLLEGYSHQQHRRVEPRGGADAAACARQQRCSCRRTSRNPMWTLPTN